MSKFGHIKASIKPHKTTIKESIRANKTIPNKQNTPYHYLSENRIFKPNMERYSKKRNYKRHQIEGDSEQFRQIKKEIKLISFLYPYIAD